MIGPDVPGAAVQHGGLDADAVAGGHGLHELDDLADQGRDRQRLARERELVGLDLRQVEQLVHELEQVLSRLEDDLRPAAPLLVEIRPPEEVAEAED